MSPTRSVLQSAANIWRIMMAADVMGLAAQAAYFFFFSLFPLSLFLAPLLSVLGNRQYMTDVLFQQLAKVVPSDAFRLVQGILREVVFVKGAPGVISLGAVLTLWAGSNVFSGLGGALNHAFGTRESRPWWKTTLIACAFVIGASLAGVVATAILLDGEAILQAVAGLAGMSAPVQTLWTILQYPIALAFVVLFAWAVYYFLPNLRLSAREALKAALAATVLWLIVTLVFRAYVQHFGSYNKIYGTIGAVVVLLTWMYLSMLAILTVGAVAADRHGRRVREAP
jgi:membrane protein